MVKNADLAVTCLQSEKGCAALRAAQMELPTHSWSACGRNSRVCFWTAISHSIVTQALRCAPAYNATHNIDMGRCHAFLIQYFGYRESCGSNNAAAPQVIMIPSSPVLVGRDKPDLVLCGAREIKQVIQIALVILLRIWITTNAG